MSGEKRYPLTQAREVAESLVILLAPACERTPVIAGSVRRERPDVGDVELVVIPKPYDDELWSHSPLDHVLANPALFAPRPDKNGRITNGPMNKLLVHIPSGIPVDIFATTPEHFGMAMMVRTGSREWNIRFMARLKQLGFAGHAYPWNGKGKRHGSISTPNGELDCPDELDVFRALGWAFMAPPGRV